MTDIKPVVADVGDQAWVNELIHQANVLGKRTQNGFKTEAWKACVAKLKESGLTRTVEQLKERFRYVSQTLLCYIVFIKEITIQLKNRFAVYYHLNNKSGWGWDDATHTPTNPDDKAWEEKLKE